MPLLYEYVCPEGHRHNEIRPMADRDHPMQCPQCAGWMRRKLTAPITRIYGVAGTYVRHKGEGQP